MDIVFCKKCGYFSRNRHYPRCGHPDNQRTLHDWEHEWTETIREPRHINKNNNCKWFEKRKIMNSPRG